MAFGTSCFRRPPAAGRHMTVTRAAGPRARARSTLVADGRRVHVPRWTAMDSQQREQALHHLRQAIVLVLELARQLEVLPDVAPAAPTVPMFDRPRPLFLREAASRAACGQHTIRRAIAAGQLEARRVSGKLRIEPDELERWSQQREAGVSATMDKPATKSAPPKKSGNRKAKARKGKPKLRVVRTSKSAQACPSVDTDDAAALIADAVLVGQPRQCELPWTE